MDRPGAGAASQSLGSDALLAREEEGGGMHRATTITHWTYCAARDWHCVLSGEMRTEAARSVLLSPVMYGDLVI